MKQTAMTIPEIMLIAGTRAALGAGVGLLVAGKLNHDTRKGAAYALLLIGILSTIPIVFGILEKPNVSEVSGLL